MHVMSEKNHVVVGRTIFGLQYSNTVGRQGPAWMLHVGAKKLTWNFRLAHNIHRSSRLKSPRLSQLAPLLATETWSIQPQNVW